MYTPTILPFFERYDDQYLSSTGLNNTVAPSKQYVSTFATRNGVNLDEVTNLALEMPEGTMIAGRCFRALLLKQTPVEYDFFFDHAGTFTAMVNRIHNAPEGSALRGYKSFTSVKNLTRQVTHSKWMTFSKEGAPNLRLMRTHWANSPHNLIEKFCITANMFALDDELNIHTTPRAIQDIARKFLILTRTDISQISVAHEMKHMAKEGFVWQSSYFDTGHRDTMLSKIKEVMSASKYPKLASYFNQFEDSSDLSRDFVPSWCGLFDSLRNGYANRLPASNKLTVYAGSTGYVLEDGLWVVNAKTKAGRTLASPSLAGVIEMIAANFLKDEEAQKAKDVKAAAEAALALAASLTAANQPTVGTQQGAAQ